MSKPVQFLISQAVNEWFLSESKFSGYKDPTPESTRKILGRETLIVFYTFKYQLGSGVLKSSEKFLNLKSRCYSESIFFKTVSKEIYSNMLEGFAVKKRILARLDVQFTIAIIAGSEYRRELDRVPIRSGHNAIGRTHRTRELTEEFINNGYLNYQDYKDYFMNEDEFKNFIMLEFKTIIKMSLGIRIRSLYREHKYF